MRVCVYAHMCVWKWTLTGCARDLPLQGCACIIVYKLVRAKSSFFFSCAEHFFFFFLFWRKETSQSRMPWQSLNKQTFWTARKNCLINGYRLIQELFGMLISCFCKVTLSCDVQHEENSTRISIGGTFYSIWTIWRASRPFIRPVHTKRTSKLFQNLFLFSNGDHETTSFSELISNISPNRQTTSKHSTTKYIKSTTFLYAFQVWLHSSSLSLINHHSSTLTPFIQILLIRPSYPLLSLSDSSYKSIHMI